MQTQHCLAIYKIHNNICSSRHQQYPEMDLQAHFPILITADSCLTGIEEVNHRTVNLKPAHTGETINK